MSETGRLFLWLLGAGVWLWICSLIAEATDGNGWLVLIGWALLLGSWWWCAPQGGGGGELAAWMGY